MAEEKVDSESLLSRAKEREIEYDWSGAADFYRNALSLTCDKDVVKAARIGESLAYALFKAAFQADSLEAFRSRMDKAVVAYHRATEVYQESHQSWSPLFAKRCEAMLSLTNYWLASDQQQRKKLISETWKQSEEALKGFEEIGDFHEQATTFCQLAFSAALAFNFEEDFQNRERLVRSAVDNGEKVIKSLSPVEDSILLAAVCLITSAFLSEFGARFHESRQSRPYDERAGRYWKKAMELSETQTLLELWHMDIVGRVLPSSVNSNEEAISFLQNVLSTCRKTRDRLKTGCVLEWLAGKESWIAWGAEDRDARDDLLDKNLKHAREAKDAFSSISYVTPAFRGDTWVEVPETGYYVTAIKEKDLAKKRHYAEVGLEYAREELRRAFDSGYPDVIMISHDIIDHFLIALAETDTDPEKKASLLEEAIDHRTKSLRLVERYHPFDEFMLGWWQGPLGHAKLELAKLTEDPRLKEELLRAGIRCEDTAVELTERSLSPADELDATTVQLVGYCRHKSVDGLHLLYDLTGRPEHLERAIENLDAAAQSFQRANMVSRMAECRWKAAIFLDILDEHLKASEKFRLASNHFKAASEKLPRLAPLYQDYSQYMLAWEGIERARYHHSRQQYDLAKESYEKAAELHQSTGKWSFLSSNYFAWARVENAEDLSQKEGSKESIESFRDAARLFGDSKTEMQGQLVKIENSDEKQMVERLIDAADRRRGICEARSVLEEARLSDKEGSMGSASEKYGRAAEMFTKIKQGLVAEQERKEIELIICLSRAWKAMAIAEAESSPELYEEAAHLFDEAKNLSPGDRAKNLAMGHSRLCMALGAGARYADSGDAALHAAAAQNLESAAKFYLKADMQSAAEYSKASKLLFDSYYYMNKASGEEDQQKKTRFYSAAEKVLLASASSYEKADQPGRKEQVLRLLNKVKEDRELAMSLAEVFRAPDIVSTAMAFPSPAPTHEIAVGLDRFEHADVQATLIAKPKELHVGQELSLEIELINAGRGPAQLTKVEATIPKGFLVVQEPEKYRMEDSQINLKGRRLDALKTEDVRLVVKPSTKGRFRLNPRIMYLDDSGANRTCEPAPVEIVVKEMGISGWIKGT